MYAYANNSIWLVNSLYTAAENLQVNIAIYNYTSACVYQQRMSNLQVGADGTLKVALLPSPLPATTKTYFLVLSLYESEQQMQPLTTNTYWLSTTTDKLDWKKSTWYNTPLTRYADFNDLNKLPPSTPNVTVVSYASENTTLLVQNPDSDSILFFVRLRLLVGGADVLPVLWSDNYITLLPLAQMTITAQHAVLTSKPDVVAECWNNRSGNNNYNHQNDITSNELTRNEITNK